MAANKLTALQIKNLKPSEKEQLISDGDNLYVVIRAISNGGSKSFRYSYRINRIKQWVTLNARNLADARAERDSLKAILKKGLDPKLEKKLEIERQRALQLAEQQALLAQQNLIKVNNLFERWVQTDLQKRKDLSEIKRMFHKDVLPILGDLIVADVKKSHIMQVTDSLKKRDVTHLARNLLKLMRQMFRFAVDREIIDSDPTSRLSITKVTTKPTERDRTLSELEIIALAQQLPSANLLKSTECALWIALSTMCRIGELSKTKISDIDFKMKVWNIPKENSKNGKTHNIFLSDFAINQFTVLKQYAKSDTWIFTNRDGSSHVCEKSITKQIGGRQCQNILSNRSKDNQALILTGGKWTPHDLRRTGATLMGNLGVAPDIIEKYLNHTEENKVKRIYQRQKLENEQAEAWQKLGEYLDTLLIHV
jgi:integrase